MTTLERIAYLRGLSEGLGIDRESREGKIFAAVTDILESLADEVCDLDANLTATAEAVNDMSEDLCRVEELLDEEFFDDDYDDDYDDFDDDDFEPCAGCSACTDDEDDDDFDDFDDIEELEILDGAMYEVTCPACGDVVTVDESILSLGKIECPGCGETLEFDLGEENED